jgi:hypothetical protein
MECGLAVLRIDWSAPWLAPWRDAGQPAAAQVGAGASCAQALNHQLLSMQRTSTQILPPRNFVPQSALPTGMAYEQFIFETGQIPTRDGMHDFFNGLCWMQFPRTKLRLNELQAEQIRLDGVGQVRGPVRDALTIVDENAALLLAPDDLWDALVARDWQTLFVRQRALWSKAHLILFGHALLEKLTAPRKSITAHVLRVHPDTPALEDMDKWFSAHLHSDVLATKPFAPLPVLGVPGWWTANEDAAFYEDANVFRIPNPSVS